MNERIRELMEQVVRIEIDLDSNCETIYTCGPEDFLEFAQLIVRQCIFEMMHECVMNPASSIPIQDFMTVVAKRIQTSFGVE